MISIKEILFFVVVFFANVIQCITGFAGTVLAMPFSIMLVGFESAKPILNVLGIAASIGVLLINRKALNKKEFLRIIVFMIGGMLIGFAIIKYVSIDSSILFKILGAVVLAFMVVGCRHSFSKSFNEKEHNMDSSLLLLILIFAGIVHGMFVCGGPLFVMYASQRLKDRNEFRVTVSAVWVVLNSIILFTDVRSGAFNSHILLLLAGCLVTLLFALWLGNKLVKHMNKKTFFIITYVLMGISGLSLIFK